MGSVYPPEWAPMHVVVRTGDTIRVGNSHVPFTLYDTYVQYAQRILMYLISIILGRYHLPLMSTNISFQCSSIGFPPSQLAFTPTIIAQFKLFSIQTIIPLLLTKDISSGIIIPTIIYKYCSKPNLSVVKAFLCTHRPCYPINLGDSHVPQKYLLLY